MKGIGTCLLLAAAIVMTSCIGGNNGTELAQNQNPPNQNPQPTPTPGATATPTPSPTPPGTFPLSCNDTQITSGQNGDGSWAACVPPLHPNQFVYLKLVPPTEVFPVDPANSTEWDIAIKNWVIKTNGGELGIGGAETAYQVGGDFFGTGQALPPPYFTDQTTVGTGFFEGWNDYAFLTYPAAEPDQDLGAGPIYLGVWKYTFFQPPQHTLIARDVLFTVKGANGTYYKVKILSNYKDLSQGETGGPFGYTSFYVDAVTAP